MEQERRFAVLIDADNISDKYIKFILDEISNEGIATYKRIYGDWTRSALGGWKNILLEYSITPIQQYGYTSGKNATDAAMIIDAMDILYSGNVEGFCLVTSDSDFTRLASRLRESGMDVVGMGEKKTPKAFVVACDKFKYLDILTDQDIKSVDADEMVSLVLPSIKEEKKKHKNMEISEEEKEPEMTPLVTIKNSVMAIIREYSDDEGWISIGSIGNMLLKRHPDFDVRNFGYKKLKPFMNSLGDVEIRTPQDENSSVVYAREKPKRTRRSPERKKKTDSLS